MCVDLVQNYSMKLINVPSTKPIIRKYKMNHFQNTF